MIATIPSGAGRSSCESTARIRAGLDSKRSEAGRKSLRVLDPAAAKRKSPELISNLPGVFAVRTEGNDEVWVQFNAKANTPYALQTSNLPANSIDTVIEAFEGDLQESSYSDDDGGNELASLLTLVPEADVTYRVKVQNIDSASGYFTVDIREQFEQQALQ